MLKLRRRCAGIVLACASVIAPACFGRPLDKGHQILIDRGLQIQALAFSINIGSFTLSRFQAANFTTVNWSGISDNAELGPAPGVPWARWSSSFTEFDLLPQEQAYKQNFVAFQCKDEEHLDDPVLLDRVVTWFDSTRNTFPNTLLYTNQGPDVPVSDATLLNFMTRAKPDMLSYDEYPFVRAGLPGGSPTTLYNALRKYRAFANGGNDHTGARPIPFGFYTQTFEDAARHVPSDSEMRLNEFALWTFGGKFANAFVYNGGQSSLVMNSDDGQPTPRLAEVAETNRQSRNLGPALVRLLSTDVRFINGQNATGANPTPIGMQNWVPGADDPYITSITAANLGATNSGLKGDVLVGYFKVLDESFDGPGHSDETYFMLTNGLSDAVGLTSETRQRITVDFDFGASGITGLERLSRLTGLVEAAPLISLGGSLYRLNLDIDGGTGDLFKFADGAPFVGVPEPTAILLLMPIATVALRRRRSRI